MEENKNEIQEQAENIAAGKNEDLQAQLAQRMEAARQKAQEATEAMGKGRGVLRLEAPIKIGGKTVDELKYDFTALTGLEYTDAMDSDKEANNAFRITYRQALALFAKAAAKYTDGLDMRDIIENIGITDTTEGVQLATLFFNASTRAGRMRITKMS